MSIPVQCNDDRKVIYEWFDDSYAKESKIWFIKCLNEESAILIKDGIEVAHIENQGMLDLKKHSKRSFFEKASLDVMKYCSGPIKLGYAVETISLDKISVSGFCIIDLRVENPSLLSRLRPITLRSERRMLNPDLHHKIATEDDLSGVVEDAILFVIRDVMGITPYEFVRSRINDFSKKECSCEGLSLEETAVILLNKRPNLSDFGLRARQFSFIIDENEIDRMEREYSTNSYKMHFDDLENECRLRYESKLNEYSAKYEKESMRLVKELESGLDD